MPQDPGRRLAILLCACLWLSAAAPAARQAQQPQQPVFRGGVDLVTLDVTVVDKSGTPVKGLTADDFVVTLQGQRRPVRVVDYQEFAGSAGASDVAPASAQTTNQSPAARQASRGGRIVVLLIDDFSIKAGHAKELMVSAERMLASLDPADLVGITTTSGLGIAVSPTRDRGALLAALKSKKLVGKYDDVAAPFYISVPEALDIDRDARDVLKNVVKRECDIVSFGEACPEMVQAAGRRLAHSIAHVAAMQLAAYAAVIEAMKAAPKPRVVIALSSGVATGTDGNMLDLEPVSRAAAEVGVQFYALTEVDDGVDLSDGAGLPCRPPCIPRPQARRIENDFLTTGVQTVAEAAGGEAFKVIGQGDRFFTRILAETSGVYRLGVEAPLLSKPERFLNVKVSVARRDVTIRANRHALVPAAAAPPIATEDALRTRIAQGGVAFGVPVALATALRRDPAGDSLQLGVNLQVPASVPAPLTVMFALVDGAGRIAKSGGREIPAAAAGEDYLVSFPIPLTTGAYHLRLAVADANGNIGSVERGLDARLPHLGTLSASELFTSWIGATGDPRFLGLETLPPAAVTLRTAVELYPDPGAQTPDLQVQFTLFRTGQDASVMERDVTPEDGGGRLSATSEMDTAALAPGTYTIRATVLQNGQAIGTVSAVFRKAAPQ